jgi:hypothetical protein
MVGIYRLLTRCSVLFALVGMLAALMPPLQPASADELHAAPFIDYYWQHEGARVLGNINSPVLEMNGYRVQYFEKARLEDHRHQTSDPAQAVRYSPLTLEMMENHPDVAIDGMPITYGELRERHLGQYPPPPGFVHGPMQVDNGVFIPYEPHLTAAPGYVVPFQFWTYLNRHYLFPGGWQHAAGLPITNAFDVLLPAADGGEKRIIVQAFQNMVLTLDLSNVYGWPVAPANVGTDMLWASGTHPLLHLPAAPPPSVVAGPKRIEVSLARQWLFAYEGNRLVLDVPVSTGKDGFQTPPGRFAIYSKVPIKTLRGRANGESWNVPDVPSILFYRGGFAIHGVYWHDRFGTGERYSHGCVGLAPDDAAVLYAWAERGTPVIIHQH